MLNTQKSIVHLILLVILAGWHNLFLLLRIGIDTPDLSARPGEQDHPILISSNVVLLNTFARLINQSWANPAVASASILKSATRTSPKTTPSAPPSYSGKKTIFLMKKKRVILLQTGGDLKYFIKPCNKESAEQPTKPQPPPAPNIDLPAKASPNVLSMTAKPTQTMMTTHSEQKRQMKEKQQANLESIRKMEEQRPQQIEKKKEWY